MPNINCTDKNISLRVKTEERRIRHKSLRYPHFPQDFPYIDPYCDNHICKSPTEQFFRLSPSIHPSYRLTELVNSALYLTSLSISLVFICPPRILNHSHRSSALLFLEILSFFIQAFSPQSNFHPDHKSEPSSAPSCAP